MRPYRKAQVIRKLEATLLRLERIKISSVSDDVKRHVNAAAAHISEAVIKETEENEAHEH